MGGIAYTFFLLLQSQKEKGSIIQDELDHSGTRSLSVKAASLNAGLFAVGMIMLIAGSQWLVESAITIATFFGASPLIIGLTVIAFGTSLPELATSVMATFRGERDLAVWQRHRQQYLQYFGCFRAYEYGFRNRHLHL